jgi:hypothetical protein
MQISFNASITVELSQAAWARLLHEYGEVVDNDFPMETEALYDMASQLEGQSVDCLEGRAWLAFVDEGVVI